MFLSNEAYVLREIRPHCPSKLQVLDRDAHYCWIVGVDEGGTIPFMRM
jgi:hypothetical protein